MRIYIFFKHTICVKPYVPREPRRDPSNPRFDEHGIYIRHCKESNSQLVQSQSGADTTRPQWRTNEPMNIEPMIILLKKLFAAHADTTTLWVGDF